MEESGEEDDKDEGGEGRGEARVDEEDGGRDREDMTNLLEDEESSALGRRVFGCRSRKSEQKRSGSKLFGTIIYRLERPGR